MIIKSSASRQLTSAFGVPGAGTVTSHNMFHHLRVLSLARVAEILS